MLFLLFITFVLILYLCVNKKKTTNMVALIHVLTAYFLAISAQLLYLSKDGSYYNIITKYFYLPDFIWRKLYFLKINRLSVVTFLNLSNLSIVYFIAHLALSFCPARYIKFRKRIRAIILCYVLLCAIIFDPLFDIQCYYFLYPKYILPKQYYHLENMIQQTCHFINLLIIISSIVLLVMAFLYSPSIRVIRQYQIVFFTSYLCVCGYYIAFLSFAPAFYIKISKFNHSYTFRSIKLGRNIHVYQIFPYFLIIALLLIAYSIFRISYINRKLKEASLEISKQIDASDTTSKAFCHFIKNEIIAIQSELETIPASEQNITQITDINQRCENLYARIDEIHRSTRASELRLKEESLQDIVLKTTKPFESELRKVNMVYDMPKDPVITLLDETYFSQALHNILRNSLDAIEGLDEIHRNITIHINTLDRWIMLSIDDTGCGIMESNLKKIFTPFFSSHPLSRNWGIGLSLTYKLIHAHDGKIEVESTYGKGTKVKIFLPNINNNYC